MNGYNWTDAGTPQGRERLKELLDSRMGVITVEEGGAAMGQPYVHTWKYGNDDLYNIHNGRCFPNSAEWDAIMERMYGPGKTVRLLFLDPSPRLEPSELQWVSNALGEWAYHGDWTFRAGYDGTWYANYKDRYVDGIGTMHERETSVEYAKAAIHEWRVNHLKSIMG